MKKNILVVLLSLFFCVAVHAQNDTAVVRADTIVKADSTFIFPPVNNSDEEVYHIKAGVDVPLTVIGVAWSLYGFSKIYNKDTSTTAQVLALNRNDISRFNRSAIDQYSQKAFNTSNIFFYGAMPLPLMLMLDKKVKQDAFRVLFLYIEAQGITGILYTTAAYVHDKYRPYAYNSSTPMIRRIRGGAKNSFYAGHVALVGTSTFFIAKTLAYYHPESKIKWLWFTLAAAATATTGYLRYKSGEHFPTDILLGAGLGTLSGILVPHFHKNKSVNDSKLSIAPLVGSSNGFSLVYRF